MIIPYIQMKDIVGGRNMMLEVRHLKRIYRLKNAEPVYALNDVSLKFPETGLVFILGKSGSGKSTLLNVMGGLDKADEGEIIINGKSSKDFTGTEMDSYRNTYLGFIFQEYNILSDFTVKENISLALELQHKKATDEEIDRILKEVDLSGFAKRKPNELSGGQKQRVAIARALVKEPKIIFGDEPTGALDSNTGRQVFETLKKLSKEKLVVIVSHDRDFAEHFGDRVIELKDGKVISDITKTTVECKKTQTGLYLIGDNMLRIENGRMLTDKDLPAINEALKNAKGDVYITGDSHVNNAILESARIDKDGNREEFVDTDMSKIKEGQGTFDVVNSRFSLAKGFKMGARSLKVKPFRLAMTVLLSTISFTLFGASTTLAMFSPKSAVKDTMKTNDINTLSLYLQEKNKDGYGRRRGFTPEKADEIEKETGVKLYLAKSASLAMNPKNAPEYEDRFHCRYLNYGIELGDSAMDDFGFTLVKGELPKTSDEVCLTVYEYYTYKDFGIGSTDPVIEPEDVTMDSLIGQKLSYQYSLDGDQYGKKVTVTGIIDTHFPDNLLQYRNKSIDYSNPDMSLLIEATNDSIHGCYFYGKDSAASVDESLRVPSVSYIEDYQNYQPKIGYDKDAYAYTYFYDEGKMEPGDGEAVASLQFFLEFNGGGSYEGVYTEAFPGAYQSESKTEENLYSVQDADAWHFVEAIQEAALYKTVSDGYIRFYQDDFETAKQTNESVPGDLIIHRPDNPFSQPTAEDYANATDNQKYRLFMRYMTTLNERKETDNPYYQTYLENILDDQQTFGNKYPAVLATVLKIEASNKETEVLDSYAESHYETFYDKYKDTSEYKILLRQIMQGSGLKDVDAFVKKQVCMQLLERGNDSDMAEEIEEFKAACRNSITKSLKKYDLSHMKQQVKCKFGKLEEESFTKEFTFVGLYIESGMNSVRNTFYISKENAKELIQKCDEYGFESDSGNTLAFAGFHGRNADVDRFLDYYFEKKKPFKDWDNVKTGEWCMYIQNNTVSSVESTADMLSILTKVFLYVGIALAFFSMLLFYNFMSISINNKKREIGILRAVGAKRSDVFKIFYSEAFLISVINFFLSAVAVVVTSVFVNNAIMKEGISFAIMSPNLSVFLLLFAISILTSFVSALLPVTRIANKKPIDAIQNR